nr:class I SAM-dependent methyltransferase [Paenibacillus bovis]
MKNQIRTNNVERFSGFGDLYDQNRPHAPEEVTRILTTYLGTRPQLVIDVGCGTGLSTFIWKQKASKVIGIEPSDDMREVAVNNWQAAQKPVNIRFVPGFSHDLGIESNSVDIVTCSQSFHWMEPQSTLREFSRVLRTGGVFAAYDCDWPPAFNWEVEESYKHLIKLADNRVSELSQSEQQAHKWDKEKHLIQIQKSGLFRFAKEIVFHNWEQCDATRYTNIALSQGALQTAIKLGADDLHQAVENFRNQVVDAFAGETLDVLFSYRMRLAIK